MPSAESRRTCASFWMDESFSRANGAATFVMAGIKTRQADNLRRAIHEVRDRHHHYKSELKFTKIGEGNYKVFQDIVDVLAESDARLIASVTDLRAKNPFQGKHEWRQHAELAAKLIVGNTNRGELAVAYLDLVTTPAGHSMGAAVKRKVNHKLENRPLLDAVSLDSACNDLLQVADAVAGAIRYEREGSTGNRYKTRFVRHLAAAFDLRDLQDVHNDRVNILTLHDRRALKLVKSNPRVS